MYMKFLYRGISNNSQFVDGQLEARDRKHAIDILTKRQIKIISLSESKFSLRERLYFFRRKQQLAVRLRAEDMCRFFEKLECLLKGGLVLPDALESISRNSSNPREKSLVQSILSEVQEGVNFAYALNKFCNSLSNNELCILDVGDKTGQLVHAVSDIVKILRKKNELTQRLITGLSYPTFICLMAFSVIGLFVFYLMPRMSNLMQSLGGSLPGSVQILLHTTHFVVDYYWLILLLMALLMVFIKILYRRPKCKLYFDRAILKLPFIGDFVLTRLRYNIANTFAGLLSNSIDMSIALNLVEKTIDNSFIKQQYFLAKREIMDGGNVANVMHKFELICGTAYDMLIVGEKVGKLSDSFVDIAEMYEKHLDKLLKLFVTWSSTIALFLAFSLVAVLALSLVSSVLNFSTNLVH